MAGYVTILALVVRCTRTSAFTGYLHLSRAGERLRRTPAYTTPCHVVRFADNVTNMKADDEVFASQSVLYQLSYGAFQHRRGSNPRHLD